MGKRERRREVKRDMESAVELPTTTKPKFTPTPQETFDPTPKELPAPKETAMAAPTMIPETAGQGSSAVASDKPRGKRIGMKLLAWLVYGGSAVPAVLFVFHEFQKLKDKILQAPSTATETGSTAVQNGAVLVDIDGLAKLFEGAAVTGAVLAFAIIIYYALSAALLMCSCVSLAHPTKKFNRGVCCGGALWLMFMTLNSALQFTSYSGLVSSLARYGTGFNQSLLTSCYSFGYISAICFLLLSIAFFFWKEKIVTVHH